MQIESLPSRAAEFAQKLEAELQAELAQQYGPLMGGEHLTSALGYRSMEAFRLAFSRRTVPIPVFPIEKRRGKFALTKDVARWLAHQRMKACPCLDTKEGAR